MPSLASLLALGLAGKWGISKLQRWFGSDKLSDSDIREAVQVREAQEAQRINKLRRKKQTARRGEPRIVSGKRVVPYTVDRPDMTHYLTPEMRQTLWNFSNPSITLPEFTSEAHAMQVDEPRKITSAVVPREVLPLIQACADYVVLAYSPFTDRLGQTIWFGDTKAEYDPTHSQDIYEETDENDPDRGENVYIDEPDPNGFAIYNPAFNAIFVVFRGTSNTQEVFHDIGTSKNTLRSVPALAQISAHTGFLARYSNLREEVISAVQQLLRQHPECQNIIVTGHSLGGAIAQLAAIELCQIFTTKQVDLVTIESPRVLSSITVDNVLDTIPRVNSMIRRAARVFVPNDPVTQVPPRKLGFKHIGNAYQAPQNIIERILELNHLAVWQHSSSRVAKWLGDRKRAPTDLTIMTGTGQNLKRKRKASRKGTAEMKARMAYVRSFKKNKMT